MNTIYFAGCPVFFNPYRFISDAGSNNTIDEKLSSPIPVRMELFSLILVWMILRDPPLGEEEEEEGHNHILS